MKKSFKNDAGMYQQDIDGHAYEFEKWGADESTDVLLDLIAVVGKPLGIAVAFATNKDGIKQELTTDFATQILDQLSGAVGEKKSLCKELIRKFASKGICEGKKINFNSHYEDRLDHMFRVVAANLEVQYGNFFGGFLSSAGGALAPKPQASGISNREPVQA